MLSRTADNLHWLARSVERADFVARVLDAASRLSALPASYGGVGGGWETALAAAGDIATFRPLYASVNEDTVCTFLAFSPHNPSSIRQCLEVGRENARSVRTALTSEMWEIVNGGWLELRRFTDADMSREEFARFLEWTQNLSLAFEGAAHRTMLRNDSYWFTRIGLALERADNTARILGARRHVLQPDADRAHPGLDYFHWTATLREVSALTAYHWVYRDSIDPKLVADLLILNRQMPRSLTACLEALVRHLDLVADAYGRRGPSQRLAGALHGRLAATKIEAIFEQGLGDFMVEFVAEANNLGAAISEQYMR